MATTGYIGAIQFGSNAVQNIGSTAYGVCDTAAGTAAKTLAMPGFSLIVGATIFVKFTYTNTASNPSLNVNGTGAKPLYHYAGTPIGTDGTTGWAAGSILALTYDGTNWVKTYGSNGGGGQTATYRLGSSGNNIILTENGTTVSNITVPYATSSGSSSGATNATYAASSGTDFSTAKLRNIILTTTDIVPGRTGLTAGNIYLVYEDLSV